MDDIGKKFAERFGSGIPPGNSHGGWHQQKSMHQEFAKKRWDRGQSKGLTWEQRNFCDFINQKVDEPKELVVLVCREAGGIVVKEVRGKDFSLKRKYRIYPQKGHYEPKEGVLPIAGNWNSIPGINKDGYYVCTWRFASPRNNNLCPIELDSGGYFAPFTEEQLIKSIRQAKLDTPSFSAEETSGLYDTLEKQLQKAGDEIFIYELLQNASDKPHGEEVDVKIQLVPERVDSGKLRGGFLKFSHTGALFEPQDVAAICSAAQKSKTDISKIGYKGIGFKTVFRHNCRVEIRSGRFGFAFDERRTAEIRPELPWMTLPDTVLPNSSDEFRVDIRLFPRNPTEKLGTGKNSYRHLLLELFKDERSLLFIPRLRKVTIVLPGVPIFERSTSASAWCRSRIFHETVSDEVRSAIKYEIEANKANSRIPQKYREMTEQAVMFACQVEGRRLIPENIETSHLYCYLPATDAHWGLPFLMNTDMVPDGNRANIEYDVKDVNAYFSRVAGEKFYEWLYSLIEGGQYEYDSIFDLIPNFEECVKGRIDAAPFIRVFQEGFETSLREHGFKLPDQHGVLVDVGEIWADSIGIVEKFGHSLWERFEGVGVTVFRPLCGCKSYESFIARYGKVLGVKVFGWDELKAQCGNKNFQEWLKNPNANDKFISFLIDNNVLGKFADIPIFLDNRGDLGRTGDMYPYGEGVKDIEQYLPRFVHLTRYLSSKVNYHDKIPLTIKFKVFDPRTFVLQGMLSPAEVGNTKKTLKDFAVSKGFWCFVAKYRACNGRERFVDCYDQLGSLPIITEVEGGAEEVVDSILSGKYSVYVLDEHSDAKILQYKWFNSRVRYISRRYFEGDGGTAIKEMLTTPLFLNRKRLVGKVELFDASIYVFNKFKEAILAAIRAGKSDLGVYSFLSDCAAADPINYKNCLEKNFRSWPVEGINGFTGREGCSVWHFNKELIDIVGNPWFDSDGIVVLAEKYLEQKGLFDILGVKDFEKVGFGEFFREEISIHLNKECDDSDIVAFHEYMREQLAAGKLVSERQLVALKRTPALVLTKDGVCRSEGCEGVLIVEKQIDVSIEVSEGRLPGSVKVLDPRLLAGAGMVEYWKRLGCQKLDEPERLKNEISAYHELQNKVQTDSVLESEFKTRHVKFVMSMCRRDVDAALLRDVKLIDGTGVLANPQELVLGEKYLPTCAFQHYGCNMRYVSECYCGEIGPEATAMFLRSLGVRDEFGANDVSLLADKDFCKYYWTEYCRMHAPDDEIIKAMRSVPCVLDRSGAVVRKPCEFYSLKIERPYVDKIGAIEKLPLREGVNAEVYDKLGLKESLTGGDAVSFLLADKAGNEYKYRGRALGWIASGTLSPEDAERYRSSEDAVWKNAKDGRMTHIRDLCVIGSKDANRVRSLFGNSEFVIDLRGIHDNEDHIGKADVEKGLERLGVVVVRNSSLKPLPKGERQDACISGEVKARLLILLASSSDDGWEDAYDQKSAILDTCHFYLCDSFEETCETFGKLKSGHGTYSERDNIVYYVGGWQDKRVYIDVVKFLKKKLNLELFTDEDLKEAFDTDGGLPRLARRVVDDYRALVGDEMLSGKLKKDCPLLFAEIHRVLKLRMSEESGGKKVAVLEQEQLRQEALNNKESSSVDTIEPLPADSDTNINDVAQPSDGTNHGETINGNETDGPLSDPWTANDVTDEERSQLENLFRNDQLSPEAMCDQNRLVTLRLYNYLKERGYEPQLSKREFNRDFNVHAKGGTDIKTRNGDIVHVISAFRGVAYISPYYWRGVCGRHCIICAVIGHMRDDFREFKSEEDLREAMRDDLAVVRVAGEDRARQVSRFFDVKQSDLLNRNVLPCSAFKVYALIRVKQKTTMDVAFDEGDLSWNDEMSQAEAMNVDKSDYWD